MRTSVLSVKGGALTARLVQSHSHGVRPPKPAPPEEVPMKWIVIDATIESSNKTKRFLVSTADRSARLGTISFYPRWRKYSFYPYPETLYESDCLRDIANFCESETKMWRAALTK